MTKIAFIVPKRLGDALMATPAFRVLAKRYPEASIDVISAAKLGLSVFNHHPDVHEQWLFHEVGDNHFPQYDFAVISHRDAVAEMIGDALKTKVYTISHMTVDSPQAEQQLKFISVTFDMPFKPLNYELFPSPSDAAYIAEKFPRNKKILAFHLGCHGIAKKNALKRLFKKKSHPKVWPLKYFIDLGRLVSKHMPDVQIILTGTPSEVSLARDFMKKVPAALSFCGETNVQQLAALMLKTDLLVSSDTGVMHVACAMKTPLIALFGATKVENTGPYPPADFRRVLRGDSMMALTPAVVFEAVQKMLSSAS